MEIKKIIVVVAVILLGFLPSFIALYSLAFDSCWKDGVISSKTWLIIFASINLPLIIISAPTFAMEMNKNKNTGTHWISYVIFLLGFMWNVIWIIIGGVSMNLNECTDYTKGAIIFSIVIQSIQVIFGACGNYILCFF